MLRSSLVLAEIARATILTPSPLFETKINNNLLGFGCWLSGVDINTQQSFEQLNQRAVAVVIDPIQSVKGKVVIDAFRLISPQTLMLGQEPRQTTSNLGHLNKPSIQALIHGLNRYGRRRREVTIGLPALNLSPPLPQTALLPLLLFLTLSLSLVPRFGRRRHYYSIAINYRKNELEEKMLLNLNKKKWSDGLCLKTFESHTESNEETLKRMADLAKSYVKSIEEEQETPIEKRAVANVGKQDAKKHLEASLNDLMGENIIQCLGTMLDTVAF